jgi:hypothetical protein
MRPNKTEYICNWCGESCSLGLPSEGPMIDGGLLDAEITGGYNSTPGNGDGALDDMTLYQFSLCEFCLDYLFEQFKIPPKVHCLIDDGKEETYRPAYQRVQEEEWRKQKEKFFRESFRRGHLRAGEIKGK